MTTEKKTRESYIADFAQRVLDLKLALDEHDQTSVLAWDNVLCVGWTKGEDAKPYACCVMRAEVVATPQTPEDAYAFIPIVRNGRGEEARLVRRQVQIAREIAELEKSIAFLRSATFEPIKGYSTPVVRVSRGGAPVFTLSFTAEGKPINAPEAAGPDLLAEAWGAWVSATSKEA